MDKFSSIVSQHLGFYVYALVDPRDQTIFYVGKGRGNRPFNHLALGSGKGPKAIKIKQIRAAKREPIIEVIRYGLTSDKEAFEIESAVIDAIGFEKLTNIARGHGVERGRQTAGEINRLYGSKPVSIESIVEPYMMFFINRSYSPTISELELYDGTRQFWRRVSAATRTIDPNVNRLPYPIALAVVDSVVVRVYTIEAWFPAGTTFSSRQSAKGGERWEFVGQKLMDHILLGRRLEKNGVPLRAYQNGFGYIN